MQYLPPRLGLTRTVRAVLATFFAPLAAAPAGFSIISLAMGDGLGAAIKNALVGMLTFSGMIVYAGAFIPVLMSGTAMLAIANQHEKLWAMRYWLLAGALLGALTKFIFVLGNHSHELIVPFAAAGAACALTYRLIVGRPADRPTEAASPAR